MEPATITPFEVSFDAGAIADLHRRLDDALWPEPGEHNERWSHGMPLSRLKQLASSWRQLDFSQLSSKLNSVPHFKTTIEGLDLHFICKRSPRPDAIPLLLAHGWPGSFLEFVQIVEPLSNPSDPKQPAFHVVVPSMPGFTYSAAPSSAKWNMHDTARVYDALMQRLFPNLPYLAQGGDWGSITTRLLAHDYPKRCVGVHINFCPAPAPGAALLSLFPGLIDWVPFMSAADRARGKKALKYLQEGSGYRAIQETKPTTLSYGLVDSPIGLLSWIAEKMDGWVDAGGEKPLSDETILANISLYWFTRCIGTSCLPYKQNEMFQDVLVKNYISVPAAHSVFPQEIAVVPQWVVARTGNFVWFKTASKGGHFASLEQPEIFLEHLREALPLLWRKAGQKAAKL